MSIWATAGAVINAAFADPEPITYMQGGTVMPPITAIRSDEGAPAFDGPGRTLRSISYEIQQRDLPVRPVNGDTFTHRNRRWRVIDVTTHDDVGAWRVVVTDTGAAA